MAPLQKKRNAYPSQRYLKLTRPNLECTESFFLAEKDVDGNNGNDVQNTGNEGLFPAHISDHTPNKASMDVLAYASAAASSAAMKFMIFGNPDGTITTELSYEYDSRKRRTVQVPIRATALVVPPKMESSSMPSPTKKQRTRTQHVPVGTNTAAENQSGMAPFSVPRNHTRTLDRDQQQLSTIDKTSKKDHNSASLQATAMSSIGRLGDTVMASGQNPRRRPVTPDAIIVAVKTHTEPRLVKRDAGENAQQKISACPSQFPSPAHDTEEQPKPEERTTLEGRTDDNDNDDDDEDDDVDDDDILDVLLHPSELPDAESLWVSLNDKEPEGMSFIDQNRHITDAGTNADIDGPPFRLLPRRVTPSSICVKPSDYAGLVDTKATEDFENQLTPIRSPSLPESSRRLGPVSERHNVRHQTHSDLRCVSSTIENTPPLFPFDSFSPSSFATPALASTTDHAVSDEELEAFLEDAGFSVGAPDEELPERGILGEIATGIDANNIDGRRTTDWAGSDVGCDSTGVTMTPAPARSFVLPRQMEYRQKPDPIRLAKGSTFRSTKVCVGNNSGHIKANHTAEAHDEDTWVLCSPRSLQYQPSQSQAVQPPPQNDFFLRPKAKHVAKIYQLPVASNRTPLHDNRLLYAK